MMKKLLSILLAVFLINLATMPSVFASEGKTEKETKFAEKVRTEIKKLGIGMDSKVQVKLKDGTRLKGYVSEINDTEFTVTDANERSTTVPYLNAKQVKGNNFSTGVIVVIGLVAFLIILGAIVSKS